MTFEYALISGENDRPEDVKLLQQKLSGMLCHVNLIPLNEVEETGFSGSSRKPCRRNRFTAGACGDPGDGKTRAGK